MKRLLPLALLIWVAVSVLSFPVAYAQDHGVPPRAPFLCPDGRTPVPANGVCPTTNTGGNNASSGASSGSNGPAVIGCDTTYNTIQNGLCIPKNPISSDPNSIANTGNITVLLARVVIFFLYFAGIIAVIFVIIGGYQYMTARGSEEDAGKGRKTITNAIIGLVIIILAYVIINAVTNFLIKS